MKEYKRVTHDLTWEIRKKDGKLIRWGTVEKWAYEEKTWNKIPNREEDPYKWFSENKNKPDLMDYEIIWVSDEHTYIKKTETRVESADEAIKQTV